MIPHRPVLAPRSSRRARIGLTPLVDVVFILLVFFMLASRLEDQRAVTLDAAGGGQAGVTGALLIELRPEGLRLGGEALSGGALSARLADRLAASPDQRVLIRPAAGVPMQRMATLLDRLQAAGVRDVALLPGAR